MTPRRVLVWRVASVVLGVGAAVYAVTLVVRDATARRAIADAPLALLAAGLALSAVAVAADSLRFRMAVPDEYRGRIARWLWHRVFGVGRMVNLVVPQAGSAYRAAHLRIEYGIPVAISYAAVAATTLLGLALAWMIGGVVLLGRSWLGLAMLAVGGALLAAVALAVSRTGKRPDSPGDTGRLRRIAAEFARGLGELSRRHVFLRVLGVSALSEVTGAIVLILAAAALGVPDAVLVGTAVFAGSSVAATVSLTPGGIGLAELAAALSAVLIDVGAATGVLIAIIGRLASVGALIGFVAFAALMERLRPHS